MKKRWVIYVLLMIILSNVSALRINEVELNPSGTDSGNEWVELYSENEIDLTDYILKNNDGDEIELNFSFSGHYIIKFSKLWLDNSDEKVFLYNRNELIDETDLFADSENNEKTWQYCSEAWNFSGMTKNSDNECENEDNTGGENLDNPNSGENSNDLDDEIKLELEWDNEEIINGKEFEIKLKAFNLEDKKYDVRVWIEFKDNDTIISDRYDGEWKSGRYYAEEFLKGPGNKTKNIDLRIRGNYINYQGDAKILFKLRDIEGIDESIEILEKEDEEINENTEDNNLEEDETETFEQVSDNLITGNVIKLGNSLKINELESEDIKTQNNVIYESEIELVKKYAIWGFALLCVLLSILLILNKL